MAGGRPTKYEGEKTYQAVYAIIEKMEAKDFFSFCGVEQIAEALGVHRDTIYEWRNKHDEFSDAIKKWETKRNALFYKLAISPQVKDAKWIFLAKNWLGMTDKQELEHKGGVKTDNKLVVEVVHTKKDEDKD